jgi:hypothetical protein
MQRKTMRGFVAMAFVLVFVLSASAFASDMAEEQMVIPDLLVGKPMGLLALGAGGLTYLVTLPITLPFGWQKAASEALVKRPYRWTFERGLGEDLNTP